jgi:hypothetical protein
MWMEIRDWGLRWIMRQFLGNHGNFVFSILGMWTPDYDSGMDADFAMIRVFVLISCWPNANKIAMNMIGGCWCGKATRNQDEVGKAQGEKTRRMHNV